MCGSDAKTATFCAIYTLKRSFYQDRLGTNIGKVDKRVAFFSESAANIDGSYCDSVKGTRKEEWVCCELHNIGRPISYGNSLWAGGNLHNCP